jgi:lysophospholipase L1-like esterase
MPRLVLLCALLLVGPLASAQDAPKKEEAPKAPPFEANIVKFEEGDKKSPPSQGAILFLGSSSIVQWKEKEAFPDLQTINRGFGGSEISDSVRVAERIAIPYKPRLIVFYAGDNDIAKGKSPERCRDDFVALSEKVHAALPETRIIFVSIKPCPSRWKLFDKQTEANKLIAAFCGKHADYLTYFSIVEPMLGDDGQPRAELFQKDNLHMSPAGYAIWNERLRPLLAK